MKVIVLDWKLNEIDSFSGSFSNGVFKYSEGGFTIPLINKTFDAEEKTIPLNYKKLVWINGEKTGIVKWDGKDYAQIFPKELANGKWMISPDEIEEPKELKEANKLFTLRDYTRESKLTDMLVDAQLTKPTDLSQIIKWVEIAVLMLLVLIAYYGTTNLKAAAKSITAPLNLSIQQNQVLIRILQNQTHQLYILYNKTQNSIP